ncbi:methyltransferase domain-containing protein 11 [Elsinoe australis]|uniref:Methyltransferase domain-containing protein 11 n=1 Tax=Elsinoe australis TaxID=40998 RepID=A0A4V6DUQ6_9PEZI|nr:methyltransferase domain-containing protein 11 [Elsinoe australis]
MSIKTQAQTGFAKAADYDTHRPSFSAASVDILLENVRLLGNKGATVIDLAAGTGKFTEILAKREERFKIIAVEPHDDMRAVLEKKQLPGVEVLKGLSTEMPLPDGSADAVIAAQAFHWFSNFESLKEINRVLQPHGAFGMIWNIEDYNAPKTHNAATAWEGVMQEFICGLDDGSPRYRHEQWRKVFDQQLESNPLLLTSSSEQLFALPLGNHEERWEVVLPKDKIWDRLNTLSQISVLEGKEREEAEKLFQTAINKTETEVNEKGEVAIHGGTYSHWTTKIPQ